MSGDKTVEVRKYALGHRQIAHPDVEMWLVETRCRSVAASNRLLIEGVGPLVHPPPYAQIVGTVTFSEVEQGSWEKSNTGFRKPRAYHFKFERPADRTDAASTSGAQTTNTEASVLVTSL